MTFEEWAAGIPEEIRGDSLWKVAAYRLALFLADLGWHDTMTLAQQGQRLLGQIIRLLLTMVPQQRGGVLRESTADYQT